MNTAAVQDVTTSTTDASAPVLEMVDVGKSYGNVNALRGVSLRVRQGEVTCVLGDNGAGKSTLIKIMAGLHDYTEGQMKVNGIQRNFGSPRVAQASGIARAFSSRAFGSSPAASGPTSSSRRWAGPRPTGRRSRRATWPAPWSWSASRPPR